MSHVSASAVEPATSATWMVDFSPAVRAVSNSYLKALKLLLDGLPE